jgi:hypothetical protein
MRSVDLSELAALAPFVQQGSAEPVLVKSNGQTVAAILPISSTEDIEDLMLSGSPQFAAILERSEKRLAEEGAINAEEVRRRLGLPRS